MSLKKLLGVALLAVAVTATGCGPTATTPTKAGDPKGVTPPKADDHEDHDHGPGPHGGTIIEFGKHHAEFCVDHDKKQVTIYILSGNLKKAVPIPAEKLLLSIKSPQFQVDVKASPLEGEPKGQSSRFVATHDNFGKEQDFEGTLSGEIEGKPYLGDFRHKHSEDEHKGHDHKGEKK